MKTARSHRSPAAAPAFTLVELLLAMTVTAILMMVVVQLIGDTQRAWSNASTRVTSFRSARTAFEAMSRRLEQATLNAFWGYDNPDAPTFYQRQSELHFVSGPATVLLPAQDSACGHAVFFQAPLGIAEGAEVQKLDDTLNGWGYWVSYGSDLPQRPAWMRDDLAVNPVRKRFRLMEYRPPAEQVDLFRLVAPDASKPSVKKPWIEAQTTADGLYDWFRKNLETHSQPVADDILCMVLQPLAPATSASPQTVPSLAPDGHYDTRRHQWSPGTRANQSRHQMPTRLLLTLVAIDGNTWQALPEQKAEAAAAELGGLVNDQLFKGSAGTLTEEQMRLRTGEDLATLEERALALRLRLRTFTTTVPVRAARWLTTKEQGS